MSIKVGGDLQNYWQNKNGLWEPYSIIATPTGTFSYTPPGGALHYILTAFFCTYNAQPGRAEIRDPRQAMALTGGASLNGSDAGSYATILDPRNTVYTDPQTDYMRRAQILSMLPLKWYPIVQASLTGDPAITPWIAGPYGTLMVRVTNQDGFVYGAGVGFDNEMSQSGGPLLSTLVRWDNFFSVIMSKGALGSLQPFFGGANVPATGGIAYYNLPASWSDTDPVSSSYVFRDDFMGATLNLAAWTVTQSAAGNVKIDTRFQCVKGIGNSTYTDNGMMSTATYARASGLKFVIDAWIGSDLTQLIFGLNDGGSLSFNHYNHGVIFDNSGLLVAEWQGGVGSDSSVLGGTGPLRMVRLRITPGLVSGALYEVQGGTAQSPLPFIGAPAWLTIADTRGNGAVTAATYKIAFTAFQPDAQAGGQFISDVRVYA
jgi:hypothetical protein